LIFFKDEKKIIPAESPIRNNEMPNAGAANLLLQRDLTAGRASLLRD